MHDADVRSVIMMTHPMPPRSKYRRRARLSWQKILLAVLIISFSVGMIALLRLFHVRNTLIVPTTGGTYIEGSVGSLHPLNPWFTVTNDVNRDIVSLIFAGLQKYDPETKRIEDDLATMDVGSDGRYYTLTLKENLYWHDHTPENPHPVTVEDVMFTYETVQNQEFPNSLLRQNFLGVEIQQLDERRVRFVLEEPYHFFPSNLTLGLLPKRSFEGIPVGRLDQALDFGFNPVGAGPYKFKGLVQTELSTEVTLERFPREMPPTHHLESVIFRIFPDYNTLLSDIRNLHGVRHVPRGENGEPLVPRPFTAVNYTLPQYVALFLNLDNEFLQDPNLRLALQLGTNKEAIVDEIDESVIVDTPLLEIDVTDWRYQYDQTAAQGALFNSDWNLPEKVRLQQLLEVRDANRIGPLQANPVVYLDTGAVLTMTGSLADVGSTGGTLNDLSLQEHPTNSGAWIAALPTQGSGALSIGQTRLQLINDMGDIVDTMYIWRTNSWTEFRKASTEQDLVELFIKSRDGSIPPEQRITVFEMYLDDGFLRRRRSTDPNDIRVNQQGEKLSLRLVTSPSPSQYPRVAESIKKQWARMGVHVGIEVPATRREFEEKLLSRDYDILLFGQSLLDNLDSYPYWHSSGVQKVTGNRNELRLDAYNLSQYSSLESDSLLEFIRKTGDREDRKEALEELREVLKDDVPAVFLYSPLYTFAYHRDLHGIELGNLSMHSDRFLTLHRWYVREQRIFKPETNWWSFPKWLISLM